MNDIRKNAEERAARAAPKAVGSSFETERQKQKNALAMQIDSLDESKIRKIAADSEKEDVKRQLLVAAYCRVSTDDIDQTISIRSQIKHYEKLIKSNPDWKFAGIYVDDGFSGTNTIHRQGFQKLINDARAGKFDMIITKAVSRFARNLLDCIGYIEELKNLDRPVRVFFEQESLDTGLQTSGIILFVLAMVAEEESHMKSEAMLLSLEWRFSRGRFLTPRLFGYDKVEIPDGFGGKRKILQINQREAQVVKWMYATLLNGGTSEEIAGVLTELEIPTGGRRRNGSYNTSWSASGVISLMRNERYCGDVLARKTYTPNFKDHKARKNNGKKNKYFQPDHHDAIVTRAVWNAAQRILNSKRYGHEGSYLPMRIIDKGLLTGFISMNRAWAGFDTEDYYRASQTAMGLLDEDLEVDLENEFIPDGGHRMGGLMDDHGISRIARELSEVEKQIKYEMEHSGQDSDEAAKQEEIIKSYQVVNGDMFTRIHEPVVRICQKTIVFNQSCVSKIKTDFVEILFNPVERMIIIRPCDKDHPNAIKWDSKPKGSRSLCKIFYTSMGWDEDYSFRIQCHPITIKRDDTFSYVLLFDLDNFIGRAADKKDEIILAKKIAEEAAEKSSDAKSYYFPPDEEEEPIELEKMTDEELQLLERNKQVFGVPVFKHSSAFRGIDSEGKWDEWFTVARPLDVSHKFEEKVVDGLLDEIMNDPPVLPEEKEAVYDAAETEV